MMPDPIEVKGLTGLIKTLDNIGENIFTKQLFDEIATFVILKIQERTAKGVDAEEKSFKPYSPSYALFRTKSGRSASKVNLFFTGSMMSSMTFSSSDDRTRIFFAPTQDPSGTSNPLKAFYLNQERRFFAINTKDVEDVLKIVREYNREQLEKETR